MSYLTFTYKALTVLDAAGAWAEAHEALQRTKAHQDSETFKRLFDAVALAQAALKLAVEDYETRH